MLGANALGWMYLGEVEGEPVPDSQPSEAHFGGVATMLYVLTLLKRKGA